MNPKNNNNESHNFFFLSHFLSLVATQSVCINKFFLSPFTCCSSAWSVLIIQQKNRHKWQYKSVLIITSCVHTREAEKSIYILLLWPVATWANWFFFLVSTHAILTHSNTQTVLNTGRKKNIKHILCVHIFLSREKKWLTGQLPLLIFFWSNIFLKCVHLLFFNFLI